MVSKVKQTLLAISIALILAFFIGYAINAFYPEPKYEDYCKDMMRPKMIQETEAGCTAEGGTWINQEKVSPGMTLNCNEEPSVDGEYSCMVTSVSGGYCNYKQDTCYDDYQKAMDPHNKVVFIIAVIAGLIAVFIGAVKLNLGSVSSGIMGGGVLSILYGVMRYWENAQDWLRVSILGIALVVLIWVGYKKLNPSYEGKVTQTKSKPAKKKK